MWNRFAIWLFRYICKTNKLVWVQHYQGKGCISPGTNSKTGYRIYRLGGIEYVKIEAVKNAIKQFDNARSWLRSFHIEGDSHLVGKVRECVKYWKTESQFAQKQ